jgi:hypothetical protein
VPDDAGAQGLFPYGDAIERVEPLMVEVSQKQPARIAGATLYLHPVQGVPPEWLGHLLECHLAHRVPCADGASCPLEVGRLTIDEHTAGSSVVVTIQASSGEAGVEALRRARALARPMR